MRATQDDIVSSVQGAVFTLQSVQDLQEKRKKKIRAKKRDNIATRYGKGSGEADLGSASMTSLSSGPSPYA